jgi:hypothetical protein
MPRFFEVKIMALLRVIQDLKLEIEEMITQKNYFCIKNVNINRNKKGKEQLKGELYNLPIINILGNTGRDFASGESITFDVINGHVYFETLANTKFTASGSTHTLTNEEAETVQGVIWGSVATTNLTRITYTMPTKDVMVVDLTELGNLPNNCYGASKAENISDEMLYLLVGDYHDGFETNNEINLKNNTAYYVTWDGTSVTNLTRGER